MGCQNIAAYVRHNSGATSRVMVGGRCPHMNPLSLFHQPQLMYVASCSTNYTTSCGTSNAHIFVANPHHMKFTPPPITCGTNCATNYGTSNARMYVASPLLMELIRNIVIDTFVCFILLNVSTFTLLLT